MSLALPTSTSYASATLTPPSDSPVIHFVRSCRAVGNQISPVGAAAADEQAALRVWCNRFLGGQPKLALCDFPKTGRGLSAPSNGLLPGDVALRIPLRLVLTAKALPRHPVLDSLHQDVRLALALLLEPVIDPDGAWAHYTPLLPSPPPSALHWSDQQLGRMAATPLPQQVAELKEALEQQYVAAFPALSLAFPRLFPPAVFSWPRFLWAYSIVETRALVLQGLEEPMCVGAVGDPHPSATTTATVTDQIPTIPGSLRSRLLDDSGAWLGPEARGPDGGDESAPAAGRQAGGTSGTAALVPFADMMNHHVTSALAWPRVERPARSASSETVGKAAEAVEEAMEEEALVFRALRAAAPGEEVCLYYGRLPSLQTLQYYGFVDEEMLCYELVQLDLEPPDDEDEEEEAAEQEQEAGEGEDDEDAEGGGEPATEDRAPAEPTVPPTMRAMRMSLLSSYGLATSPHFLSEGSGGAEPSKEGAHMADAHMADTHMARLIATLRVLLMDGSHLRREWRQRCRRPAQRRASAGQLDGGASDGDASKRCEGAKRAEAGTATSSGDATVLAPPPPHVPAMPLMPPMLKLAVASGLRCLVGGLAEALPPPPPRRRRGGGPPPGSSVTPTELRADHPKAAAATTPIAPLTEEATATGIDQSIELYVGFQRRVVRRALRTAAELEATALEEADQDGVDGASGSAAHEGEGVQQQQHEEEQRDGEGGQQGREGAKRARRAES